MSITVNSTTDSKEQVQAAMGDLQKEVVVEKSASEVISDESAKDSETLEAKEGLEASKEEAKEEGEPEPKKKKVGFKKRIDKLRGKLSAAEQSLEYWRQQALNAQSKTPEKQSSEVKVDLLKKPTVDDFDTHEAYIEALTDWKVEQKDLAKEAKSKEQNLQSEIEKKRAKLVEKIGEFKKTADDFDELMSDVEDVKMSFTVQQSLLDSDLGPELMYELAKNREEYERICAMPAIAAARAIGKIEARLQKTETVQKEVASTKAPPPLKTVGSKATSTTKKTIYDEGLSQREYERLREEQMSKRA